MLEVLQFVFSSFWIWLGSVILLGSLSGAVGGLLAIIVAMLGVKKG